MAEVLPFPNPGDVFTDVRGEDRTMRVSCHQDSGIVVVSIWAGRTCRASFRVAPADLARLVGVLTMAATAVPQSIPESRSAAEAGSTPEPESVPEPQSPAC
jgi:hypothetical protein